jgi:hypothetical protein
MPIIEYLNYKLCSRKKKGEKAKERVVIADMATATAVHYLSPAAFFLVAPVCNHG